MLNKLLNYVGLGTPEQSCYNSDLLCQATDGNYNVGQYLPETMMNATDWAMDNAAMLSGAMLTVAGIGALTYQYAKGQATNDTVNAPIRSQSMSLVQRERSNSPFVASRSNTPAFAQQRDSTSGLLSIEQGQGPAFSTRSRTATPAP
jgi:hypothetical protein